jgi:hypothetical protein
MPRADAPESAWLEYYSQFTDDELRAALSVTRPYMFSTAAQLKPWKQALHDMAIRRGGLKLGLVSTVGEPLAGLVDLPGKVRDKLTDLVKLIAEDEPIPTRSEMISGTRDSAEVDPELDQFDKMPTAPTAGGLPSGLPEPDMAQELMWAWVQPLADAGFGDQAGVRAFAAKVAQFQASVNEEKNLRANPEVFMGTDGKPYPIAGSIEKLTKLSNNNTTKFEALLVEGQKLHEELGLQPAIVNPATLLEDIQRRHAYDIFSTNYFNPSEPLQQEARLGMAELAVETAQRHGADAAMAISALETVWGVTEEQKELIRSKLRPSRGQVREQTDWGKGMARDQAFMTGSETEVIENNTTAVDRVQRLLSLNVANQKLSGDQAFEILQGNWNLAIQALYPSGGGPAVDISEFLIGMSTAYVSGELTFAQAMDQMNNQMSVIQNAQQERTRRTDDARTEYIRRRENLAAGLQGIDDREEAKKRDLFKMLMGLNLPPSAVGATLGGAGVVHDIAQRAGVESPEPAQIGGPINFPSEFPEFDESRQRLVESVDVGDSETAFIRDWLNQGVS